VSGWDLGRRNASSRAKRKAVRMTGFELAIGVLRLRYASLRMTNGRGLGISHISQQKGDVGHHSVSGWGFGEAKGNA
jgi:hypothetical protein